MKIRVPATSANLGPGFDSCGIALSQYLVIEIGPATQKWAVEHELSNSIPRDEKNLLIQTALKIAPKLTPHSIKMSTDIPVARGLGSSSSVIVAGIELANRLGNLNLSVREKLEIATEIEGHPDNVAPAICGSFVVASYADEQVEYVKHHFPECDVVVFIPDKELLTSASRSVLPDEFSYKEAVKASSIANVMIAAVLNGNLPLAGKMMEKDLFHEKHRKDLVPHLTEIREITQKMGGYGSYLSGAGPTVLTLVAPDKSQQVAERLKELDDTARVEILAVDQEGLQVY
ncbi:homoserine kinase [Candidatus Enterococcus ferrettii]|uniref:Homoserine kinase n=1 Tax=Candidatus Enterococcus ferrettii TaxID=2815324 RepID=A0ABV0EHP6_9ENTE|nr:homoserine kinase [Enterococcus sp. 665A]MBO1342467.1 homoserine kinase [Enterococcus sp. 665A]